MVELLNTAVIPLAEYERLRAIEIAVATSSHLEINTRYIIMKNGHTISTEYKIVSESKVIEVLQKEIAEMKENELKGKDNFYHAPKIPKL